MSPFIPENNSAETTLESDLVVNRTLPVEVVTLTPNITTYQMIHSTASVALLASISCGVIVICLLAMCAIWRWKLITRLKSMQTTGLNEETQILKCTNPPVRTDNTNNDASLLQTTYRAEEVPRSLTSDSLQSTASAADAEEGTSQPIQHSEVRRHSMTAFRFHHDLIGELDPSLYKCTDDYDQDDILPPSPHGRLWFSLVYDAVVEQLSVRLVKAKHIPGRGRNNTPRDPFVKLYLLPDERNCQQSKVRRRTHVPVWNETFIFQVGSKDIHKRTLRLSVYDIDRRRVRHALGHVLLNFDDVQLDKDEIICRDLELEAQATAVLGEINFTLTYQSNLDRLRVVIHSLRNIKEMDFEECGAYVKVQLMHGRKPVKSKKTSTQKRTSTPAYNESFSFGTSAKEMERSSVLITVMSTGPNRLSHDVEYGRVLVGPFMFARGDALLHWQEMLTKPKTRVTKWHALSSPNSFM